MKKSDLVSATIEQLKSQGYLFEAVNKHVTIGKPKAPKEPIPVFDITFIAPKLGNRSRHWYSTNDDVLLDGKKRYTGYLYRLETEEGVVYRKGARKYVTREHYDILLERNRLERPASSFPPTLVFLSAVEANKVDTTTVATVILHKEVIPVGDTSFVTHTTMSKDFEIAGATYRCVVMLVEAGEVERRVYSVIPEAREALAAFQESTHKRHRNESSHPLSKFKTPCTP